MAVISFQPKFAPCFLVATITALGLAKATSLSTGAALGGAYSILIPFYIFWTCWVFPFYISPLRHVPTVPGFPLWGQTAQIIAEESGGPQRKWHKKYGPVVRYFFPFGDVRLSFVDDESLKHMTIKDPYNFPKPYRARDWMSRLLGDGVLLAEGDDHVHQRKALAPAFSIQSIRALNPVFWRKSLNLANIMKKEMLAEGEKTKSFEVLEYLNRTTLDIIGLAGFGVEFKSLENPEMPIREAYRMVFAFDPASRLYAALQSLTTLAKYLPFKLNHEMSASRKVIVQEANSIIRSKQSQSADPKGKATRAKDIMSLIVRDNSNLKAGDEDKLSFETMRDQVMTFLGAGHDTTATGVAWTLHLLSKYPKVQVRLREEIRASLPFLFDPATRELEEKIATVDADQLPYLENVCREALRYIPPIPFTTRMLVHDDVVGGYLIPAGTTVYIYSNTINRMTEYWGPTADEFNPDRWDNLPDCWVPNAYMTFLQGPRGCIGKKFAETEMKSLLCCLLSMFSFESDLSIDDPENWKMWRLVLRPRDGVLLKTTMLAA